MKTRKGIGLFCGLALLATLVGCAQKEDVQMMQAYYGAKKTHDTKQATIVEKKSAAIEKVMTFNCSDDSAACGAAKAFSAAMASERIAEIETQEFDLKPPTTSLDVQETLIIEGVKVAPTVGITITSKAAIDKDKGQTTVDADNGSSVVIDQHEDHQTAIANDGNPTNTKQLPAVEEPEEEEELAADAEETETE